ncbi:hypothetical protein EB796_013658 [Bugula neritina]|uniref:Uncharacterized protein n=1 Tax=Bugula neritina TaxID=10212 RepID=A0A7J7JQQ8_BUGNE|nr:hypothetical protein EB796_013658 [Bugula neritina]
MILHYLSYSQLVLISQPSCYGCLGVLLKIPHWVGRIVSSCGNRKPILCTNRPLPGLKQMTRLPWKREAKHRGNLEKPVKFSIGEESLSGEITPAESSEVRPSISSPESSNAVTSHEQTTSKQTECILKVASKPMLIAGGSPTSPTVANSPVPVKALVGAFECIGSAKELNRPLTVHVDSFNSDPFTKKASTASISPLQRSQSLKALSSQNKADDNSGGSRNYTTQKQPQLHMKMKRDTLQHSISTTVIRTDNLS